jgi:hypothetical protein
MVCISIWLDNDASRLYARLTGRMDNRDFHEKFLRPLRTLGFRFEPAAVAHFIEIGSPQECGLVIRQLEANFEVSRLEKKEIFYWLGLMDKGQSVLLL